MGTTERLPPKLVLATMNRGKVAEVTRVLGEHGVEVVAADTLVPGWSVVEDGATFADNARIKARSLAAATGLPALGDDSGLEVAALGGRPGVRSARYAGPQATDHENVALLLAELRDVPPERRGAAFRCALALAWPDGTLVEAEGRSEGTIADAPAGEGGFGYDPVFVDPETGRRYAQLTPAEKDARSHRGRALAALCRKLSTP